MFEAGRGGFHGNIFYTSQYGTEFPAGGGLSLLVNDIYHIWSELPPIVPVVRVKGKNIWDRTAIDWVNILISNQNEGNDFHPIISANQRWE